MVEEVTAWRADDGTTHDTKLKAMLHDAEITLRKEIKGDEYVNFILNNRSLIFGALEDLVCEERMVADIDARASQVVHDLT